MFILQVEDCLEVAYARERKLVQAGYRAGTVRTLLAARRVYERYRCNPMIITFDFDLGSETTLDLIREIEKDRERGRCSAILLAASSSVGRRLEQLEAGCDAAVNPENYVVQVLEWACDLNPETRYTWSESLPAAAMSV